MNTKASNTTVPNTTAADKPIRVGTRASQLALAQSGMVAEAISAASGVAVELVPITSEGDRSRQSLASLGGTGVFANALRQGLLAGRCDMLVHSLKDLPTAPYEGLTIGAIPRREDARDALCARDGFTLQTLPTGSRVGTGSPRRVAQLKAMRPDLDVVDIRGNVDTRLGRVGVGGASDDMLDAVVLAVAGLTRLGRLDAVTEFLDIRDWPTAPGQGALGIEVREDNDWRLLDVLNELNHIPSELAAVAERSVLARLEAGCSAPVGTTAVTSAGMLLLTATVYRPDGTGQLTSSNSTVLDSAVLDSTAATHDSAAAERLALARGLGFSVGAELLRLGAAELVAPGSSGNTGNIGRVESTGKVL